jgi:hypothetical protein
MDAIRELLEEMNERLQNIEAKVESGAGAGGKTAAPKKEIDMSNKCTWVGPKGGLCRRVLVKGTKFCAEHPDGVSIKTPAAKKSGGASSSASTSKPVEIKFNAFANTEYEQVISPLSIKGVIVSVGKPREAFFIYRTGKFVDISEPQMKTLLNYDITMADNSEIEQAKEDIESASSDKKVSSSDSPQGTVKIATARSSTAAKVKAPAGDDEDDEEPKATNANAVRKPITRATAAKPVPKTDDDEEEEDKPAPANARVTRSTTAKAAAKPTPAEDEEEPAAAKPTATATARVARKPIVPADDDDEEDED